MLMVPFRASTLQEPRHGSISSLPLSLQHEIALSHDATDIHVMPSGIIVILNRRLTKGYAPLTKTADLLASKEPGLRLGGDTLAMFSTDKDGQLVVEGHVELGCYQPREIFDISVGKDSEAVLISCGGRDGKYGGMRRVAFSRGGNGHRGDLYGNLVEAWDTDFSIAGIAPLA